MTKKIKVSFKPLALGELREQYLLMLASQEEELKNLPIGSSIKDHEYFTKFYGSTAYYLTQLLELENEKDEDKGRKS